MTTLITSMTIKEFEDALNKNTQQIIDAVQFGHDNPETCKVKGIISVEMAIYRCSECNHKHVGPKKFTGYNFCPYCGRKITDA